MSFHFKMTIKQKTTEMTPLVSSVVLVHAISEELGQLENFKSLLSIVLNI